MGSGQSRQGYYPPRHTDAPGRYKRHGYEMDAESYQYAPMIPQPYGPQSYPQTQFMSPMPPPPIPQGLFPPAPITNPYPVIPNVPAPSIPRAPTATPYMHQSAPRYRTPAPQAYMPMPTPSPAPPVAESFVPPVPPPPVPVIPPVPPSMSMPGAPMSMPVPSPAPAGPMYTNPRAHGQPFATPVIPPAPILETNAGATPGPRRRQPRPDVTPQPRWSRLFPRPQSIHFVRHPLPRPPSIILNRPPYIGLLDELRKDPEEKLHRIQEGLRYFVVPAQTAAAPGMPTAPIVTAPVVPVMPQGDPYSSHQKKQRKGLFRTLSDALGGRSRSKKERYRPALTPNTFITPPDSMAQHAPVGVSLRDRAHPVIPNMGYPGGAPMPMRAPPIQMPSSGPSVQPPPRVSSPAHSMHRAPSPAHSMHSSMHGPPRVPSPSHSLRGPPRAPSPAHSIHGPTRAPSPSHSMRTASPLPKLVIDALGDLAGLIHTSPHPVDYRGDVFPTAFHLLQSLRFADQGLIDLIRTTPNVQEVQRIVKQNMHLIRPDWEVIVLNMMDNVLYHKFTQHSNLLSLLLRTGVAELIFEDRDDFWGTGPRGDGANELGKALVRLRERMKDEPKRR